MQFFPILACEKELDLLSYRGFLTEHGAILSRVIRGHIGRKGWYDRHPGAMRKDLI